MAGLILAFVVIIVFIIGARMYENYQYKKWLKEFEREIGRKVSEMEVATQGTEPKRGCRK